MSFRQVIFSAPEVPEALCFRVVHPHFLIYMITQDFQYYLTEFHQNREQEAAFQESKQLLLKSQALVHFDPLKPVVLSCDASPYGVGVVLSHQMPNGEERPVAFASRSLSKAEQKYSQLDKEAVAIVYGVKKFHKYIYGRHVMILTDHKLLQGIYMVK